MEPERRYTQQVKKSFHISMAALDLGSSDNEASQVMCGYEGRNYLLCTLKQPDMLQCPLDLEFAAGTEVSFASNGKAHIHLTGYLTDADEDGLNLEDLAEEEVEEEQEEETHGKKKKHKNLEKNEPPSKKAKLLNGSATKEGEDVEEEESDDPDFEEEADSDDEENGEEDEDDDEDDNDEEDEEEEEFEEPEIPKKLSKQEKKKMKQETEALKTTQQQQKKQRQKLKGGVVIEDLNEGNGPPAKPGRYVNVYYEGRLEKNNKMFDSTNKGPGFKFRLGAGEVIKAWDIGLVGMKVGGVRKIICPPHTAYGPKGSPPAIPPNSTLVFTVTLKKVD